MGRVMWILAWLCGLALATYWFGLWEARQSNPNMRPSSRVENGVVEVMLSRNRQQHFVATGAINGHTVDFLVDTGATEVSLSLPLAKRLGLHLGTPVVVNTANGQSRAYRSELARLTLGAIELENVRALVVQGLEDDQVLLGMSALKELEFTQRSGTLLLRQYK